MKEKRSSAKERYIKPGNIILVIIGIAINVILAFIGHQLHIPFYLDTIGTILAGALGGFVPGMLTGFLTNVLNSLNAPMDLYYGILSIVIGALSSIYSQKKLYKSIRGWLLVSLNFIVIAGIAGVSITWLIYGSSIGGDSESIGNALVGMGVMPYFAQLFADLIIEIPDKLISVGAVCLILKFLPENFLSMFSLGSIYHETIQEYDDLNVKKSISRRMSCIVMIGVFLVGAISIISSVLYYNQRVKRSCEDVAMVVAKQAAGYVDGDLIQKYLNEKDSSTEYAESKRDLKILYDNSPTVKYLFVYAVYDDGVHVVFDLDTPGLKGAAAGSVLEQQQDLASFYSQSLKGEAIPIEYSNGKYGKILTVYSPIKDSDGEVTAYAGVDIDMTGYYREIAIFAIQVISIVFAIVMLIVTLILWYVNNCITQPIRLIVRQTEELKSMSPDEWLDSEQWKNQVLFDSEDELAKLNETVIQLEESASINTKRLMNTEQELLQTKEIERMNKELETAVQKADDANRAKTDFLSRMSHDMRTPMNGILGMAELSEGENSIDVLKSNMSKIKDSGEYLLGLINDTLDFQRIESGKLVLEPVVVDVRSVMRGILDIIKPVTEKKKIDFRVKNVDHYLDSYILIDPLRMKQIFVNLLSNATKFTPEGGTMEFELEILKCDESISSGRVYIRDTGIGMSEDFIHNKLFEPFSQENNQVTSQYAGSGLGLSIVKSLVELMGGHIEVESELGGGTTFIVYLDFERINPEDMKKVQLVARTKKENFSEILKGKQILLAEDHPLNAEIAIKLLQRVNCTVTWVRDGQECVDAFKNSKLGGFDGILMDIRMPHMDGLDATKVIRAVYRPDAKKIPIIAMTANAYASDVQNCMDAGMSAHIAKPIEPRVMYETIASQM